MYGGFQLSDCFVFALCFWHTINSSRQKFEPLRQGQEGGGGQQVFFLRERSFNLYNVHLVIFIGCL